jgi:hypothetical protein
MDYEVYLYCTKTIDGYVDLDSNQISKSLKIKELSIEDFKKCSYINFSVKKLILFKKRLEKQSYHAYGVYMDGVLVYTTWISLSEFEMSNEVKNIKLCNDEGLILDSYCHPDYRGLGIHSYMSKFRLNKLLEYDKNKSIAILLKENIPSQKAHFNAGYKIDKVIYYVKYFNVEKSYVKNIN